ncbi:MAG: hydroxyethylthiazole kinase [Clostridia bacterium]|nr:hydroxyethylthiazole kinase [Clostridia bacterium]
MRKLNEICSAVREKRPLIHCITNPISINQCANAILAAGARPIMAEHPAEVKEITETADALMLNLGSITDVRMQSMEISLRAAKEKGIPVVLDAVGAACSGLRREFAIRLLEMSAPAVLKGNSSEIYALYRAAYRSSGVDADSALSEKEVREAAGELARKYKTTVLASAKTDIVTDSVRYALIRNGTPQLAGVTGTGCMLGALCGAYLSVCPGMEAATAACAVLGACGQMAETPKGSGTFMVNLLDALSTAAGTQLEELMNVEEIQ